MKHLTLMSIGLLIGLTIGGMMIDNDQNDKIRSLELAVSMLTEESA